MRTHVVQSADGGGLDAVRDGARRGRDAAMSRRRALVAGRSAPPAAAGDPTGPAAPDGRGTSNGAQGTPDGTAVAINGVAAGRLGRALSMQRRRQLSKGKQALSGDDRTAAAADAGPPTFVVLDGGGD